MKDEGCEGRGVLRHLGRSAGRSSSRWHRNRHRTAEHRMRCTRLQARTRHASGFNSPPGQALSGVEAWGGARQEDQVGREESGTLAAVLLPPVLL